MLYYSENYVVKTEQFQFKVQTMWSQEVSKRETQKYGVKEITEKIV